jgi:hypothetical protein
MCAKFEDRGVELFRLPKHETQRPSVGWSSEAERLRLGANRSAPLGK